MLRKLLRTHCAASRAQRDSKTVPNAHLGPRLSRELPCTSEFNFDVNADLDNSRPGG